MHIEKLRRRQRTVYPMNNRWFILKREPGCPQKSIGKVIQKDCEVMITVYSTGVQPAFCPHFYVGVPELCITSGFQVGFYCIVEHHTGEYWIPRILCLSMVRSLRILRLCVLVFSRILLSLRGLRVEADSHRMERELVSGQGRRDRSFVAVGHAARGTT